MTMQPTYSGTKLLDSRSYSFLWVVCAAELRTQLRQQEASVQWYESELAATRRRLRQRRIILEDERARDSEPGSSSSARIRTLEREAATHVSLVQHAHRDLDQLLRSLPEGQAEPGHPSETAWHDLRASWRSAVEPLPDLPSLASSSTTEATPIATPSQRRATQQTPSSLAAPPSSSSQARRPAPRSTARPLVGRRGRSGRQSSLYAARPRGLGVSSVGRSRIDQQRPPALRR